MFKNPTLILFLILFISAALRFFNIDFADGKPVFDERGYYVEAARSYLSGRDDPNPQHPPLGKELIAVGMLLFGDNPVGWRVSSLAFSLVGIFLVYLLADELFREPRQECDANLLASLTLWRSGRMHANATNNSHHSHVDSYHSYRIYFVPLASSFLLSVDSMYFIYSRLAVLDMFLTVFILLTLLFLWRVYRYGRFSNLLSLSLFFGLALATKWTALQLVPVMIVFLWLRYRWAPRFLGVIASITVITAGMYAISYAPWLTRHSFGDLVYLQRKMVVVWRNFDQDKVFTPGTYVMRHVHSWILNPVSAYFAEPTTDGKLRLVIGLFNPVVLWGGLGWLVWWVWKRRKKHVTLERSDRVSDWSSTRDSIASLQNDSLPVLFLLLPILSNYLPWFFIRRVQYSYYFLPSLPLLVVLIASVLDRARHISRDRVAIFLLSSIIMFGYLFPFLTSVSANPRFLNPLSSGPVRVRLFYDETPERTIFSP